MSQTATASFDHVPTSRILVVDDSQTVRRALSAVLEKAGYIVETADCGEAAFEACMSRPYDLVITDVTMGALSGVQLCRLLRSDPVTEATPIVMLTAANDRRSRFWGAKAGADAYLGKESMGTKLLPTVQDLLGEAAPRLQTGTFRLRTTMRPLERLSKVLDQHLFDAVVSSEVRRLVDDADDRETFARAFCQLTGTIARYAYLALELDGPDGQTYTVHARGRFPREVSERALGWLGISNTETAQLIHEGPIWDGAIDSGVAAHFPITAGSERLGMLQAFGGSRRLGGEDYRTLQLVAREIALPIKTLFLVERTRILALTDGLTGLANRRRCTHQLAHETARALRQKSAFSVAICDIDHFKRINDEIGHNEGDRVLREVAQTLAESVRTIDMVGRWGGEEFIALLPNAATQGGRIVAERMRRSIADCVDSLGRPVTVSIGVAAYREGESAEQLVARADEALYRAKNRGRNRVELEALEELD